MKKFFSIFLLVLLIRFVPPVNAATFQLDSSNQVNYQFAGQEHIQNFSSDIKINKDGTMDVVETIIYDFDSLYRHGIYRKIPYIKINQDGKKYVLKISKERVTDENEKKYHFQKSTEIGKEVELKIGDADKTITGIHTYVISYKVAGALTYFSDHDELYWNMTGNDWTVPIASASAHITMPDDITAENIRLACYTGYSGSQATECEPVYEGNTAQFSGKRPFFIGEGLTFVVGFPRNIVSVLEPKPYVPFSQTWYGKLIIGILVLFLFIAATFWYLLYPLWVILKWWRQGRDPKPVSGEVSAWYDPPKTTEGRALTPAETGALLDESVDKKDISALVVDLARRGYFKIEEEKKGDFFFVRNNKIFPKEPLLNHEIILINGIFEDGDEVSLKNLKIADTVETVKKDIYALLVKEGFFTKNPQSTRTFYIAMAVTALTTFNLPLFIICLLFGRAMPAKTQAGSDAAAVASSVKNFLTSQEEQLKFQASKQLMFERLLPFAIAFGVEKIWANRFKDFALKQPSWYSGYDSSHFNSVHFTNSMNSSMNSFSRAATPVSSSSGYSSGFSGGSSGGGGGGGGGGSW